MRESTIVKQMRRLLEASGADVTKNHGCRYSSDEPDLVACLQGFYIAIEVKVPGKKARPKQEYRLTQIRRAGGFAGVFDDPVQLSRFLDLFPFVCIYCLQHGQEEHKCAARP